MKAAVLFGVFLIALIACGLPPDAYGGDLPRFRYERISVSDLSEETP